MAIKTIVLVHGAFADGSCWAKVIPLLTKRGLEAIAVQNPLSSLADDVTAAHRVIGMQEGPVLLVGHSWGGALAAAFALDFPDRTAALILLASPFYPHAHATTSLYALFAMPIVGWIYARTLALPLSLPFVGLALGSAFLPQLPPRDYRKRSAALLLLRPSTFLANACDMADLKRNLEPQPPRYRGLAMPILVMAGAADFVVGPQLHAIPFATAVPHTRLIILPGSGHMLHHVAAERVLAEIEGLAAMMATRLTGERGA